MIVRQLVYSSFASPELTQDNISEIVSHSQEKNDARQITGMMVYNASHNQFVQVLEGPCEQVIALFRKIEADSRHHSVAILVERDLDYRMFPNWSMGFKKLDTEALDTTQSSAAVAMLKMLAVENGTHTEKPSVLVVDDDTSNVDLLLAILERDYEVCSATSGKEAIELVRASDVDAVLLDINMPDMSGFEVCAEIKSNDRYTDVPVIFISGLVEAGHKVTGLGVGGCDYISKPINSGEVLARLALQLELAELRLELNRNLIDLQEKNRRLDMFARSLAHDLRNPLGNLQSFTSMVKAGMIDGAEISEWVDLVKASSDDMADIISGLLLLATIDRDAVELEPTDVNDVAHSCVQDLEYMLNEYEGEIVVSDELLLCQGRKSWLKRIFSNLFSNALKYGGIPPKVSLSAEAVGENTVRYIVSDNGQGLEDEQKNLLFNEFTRLAPEDAPGLGLGLVLVKTLVQQMGGRIFVESQPGEGSQFIVELKAASFDRTNRIDDSAADDTDLLLAR